MKDGFWRQRRRARSCNSFRLAPALRGFLTAKRSFVVSCLPSRPLPFFKWIGHGDATPIVDGPDPQRNFSRGRDADVPHDASVVATEFASTREPAVPRRIPSVPLYLSACVPSAPRRHFAEPGGEGLPLGVETLKEPFGKNRSTPARRQVPPTVCGLTAWRNEAEKAGSAPARTPESREGAGRRGARGSRPERSEARPRVSGRL